MPMKLLQKCVKYIAPDIAKLINDSFKKCIFPDDLKFAEVSSLFKRNDALNKSNYRPVSVLIALSKIYEKAFSIQVTTVALKGHHYISFSLHNINFDLCEKILCDYVYIVFLHVYIIILHVYINILHVYIIILHVYIIIYTCIHNYLACIHNKVYMYTIIYTCMHNYLACIHNYLACIHNYLYMYT